MLAYLFDAGLKDQLNKAGRNYWDVYLEEICNLMGVRGLPLSVDEAAEIAARSEISALVVGRQTSAILTDNTRAALASWVEKGGILIGLAATGLDEVFGIERQGVVEQPGDDYTIAAHFDLRPHALTHEIHPLMFMEQRLLIISDVERVKNHAGAELGRLFSPEGVDMGCAALTWGRYGKGWAGYFAFDAAQTVWVLHQGRPIPLDAKQTRGYPRAYDLCVLGNNSRKVPYADELVFLVQNMVAQGDTAFVHQIPPEDGQVADALFYWGGDEYTGPTELSLYASDWMKSQGLPYHINIQAENHPMTEAEYQHILDNGHEVSEYYHMLAEDDWAAYEQLYARQSREFYDRFGRWPITTVNCVLRWNGWADAARWMAQAGSKADNSFAGHPITLGHPLANGPFFGFGAGTAFPFYFYDDHAHANQRIDMMEQPIVCYEVGHRGSLLDHETPAAEDVYLPVEMALKYHLTMNMFYHPIYIARYPLCRRAIEEVLAVIARRGARVVHMGNDALHHWWQARARAAVTLQTVDDNSAHYECECDYEGGMVVKVLLKRQIKTIYYDQRHPPAYELRREFAGAWLFVVVEQGRHCLDIVYQ